MRLILLLMLSTMIVWGQFVPGVVPGPFQNPVNMILEERGGEFFVRATLSADANCTPPYSVLLDVQQYRNGGWNSLFGGSLPKVSLGGLYRPEADKPSEKQEVSQKTVLNFRPAKMEDGVYRLNILQVSIGGDLGCAIGASRPFTHLEWAYLVVGNPDPLPEMVGTVPVARNLNPTLLRLGIADFEASLSHRTRVTIFQQLADGVVVSAAKDFTAQRGAVSIPTPNSFRVGGAIQVHLLDLETAVSAVYVLFNPAGATLRAIAGVNEDEW